MAISTSEWAALPRGSKAEEVRKLAGGADTWKQFKALQELLQPFIDAIHQLEADKPMLAECHVVLMQLEQYVHSWAQKHKTASGSERSEVTGRAVETFERRLDTSPGGAMAPVYNPAYTAAYALDPFHAEVDVVDEEVVNPPQIGEKYLEMAREHIKRVGGNIAATQFDRLFTRG